MVEQDDVKPAVVSDTSKIQIREQITTAVLLKVFHLALFPIHQRYKFESKSQHLLSGKSSCLRCFRYIKDTNSRANHNIRTMPMKMILLFPIHQRYKFESKSQLDNSVYIFLYVVSDTSKIQIREQITTVDADSTNATGCFRYIKDTNSRANHNIYKIQALK